MLTRPWRPWLRLLWFRWFAEVCLDDIYQVWHHGLGWHFVESWIFRLLLLLLLVVKEREEWEITDYFFERIDNFFERKKEKSEKLPNGKSDQEICRDSNRGPFAYRANALPTEPQVTVRAEFDRIRLSQSTLPPSLTSHLLPYTLHARFGNFFFFERKKEKSEKLPNGKSDQETCRDSNRGPFACQANALPTEPQVTVRGERSSNPT